MVQYTPYHAQFLAHRLTLDGFGDDAFARSLSTARVEMKPHQVDAALFALKSPLAKGAILADEVGLGKTIEAGLVIAQRWAERRRRILLIVPASLRKQWTQELHSKFSLPSLILETTTYKIELKSGRRKPFDNNSSIIITSYEFAARQAEAVAAVPWDLVVFDEAHRLRNVWKKGGAARAKDLKRALQDRFKVLLTATPLQNSLMELYGLVSVIDQHVFGDEYAFKANYNGRNASESSLLLLRERLQPVCRRTLRKQVLEAGHINYTKRLATTAHFEPDGKEHELYEAVSAFLQRKDTALFGNKPNALITLVFRKILGSSTIALVSTLDKAIGSLRTKQRRFTELIDDIDTADEIAEEMNANGSGEGEQDNTELIEPLDPAKVAAEIEELIRYRDLAASIGSNAKGEKLIRLLPQVLDEIVARGGNRKAVVFTESVRTQRYLADLLSRHGFTDDIALMNGTNADPSSLEIYKDWLTRHRGTEAISGSKTADMKAAIVEAFREKKAILIATESGAEGINLQFCSLLINFDLPWNPQRVEQRIGRCHRYGQKIDVTVVNFLNLKNKAEQRVFELLNEKFQLFDGVFGASDEVLGAISSGVDFEQRILEIVQTCRTDAEIDAAFNQLQEELAPRIDADMLKARSQLMENVDTSVVRLLKERDGAIKNVLSDFELRLLTLARSELPDARFHDGQLRRFDLNGLTYTTEWPLADEKGWQFFRLADGNLATTLVERGKARNLDPATLRFTYSRDLHGVMADVAALQGKAGWLKVSKLTIGTAGKVIEHVVLAGLTDDGQTVAHETLDRLLLVPATQSALDGGIPEEALNQAHAAEVAAITGEAERKTHEWFDIEEQKLARYAEDLEKGLEAEIAQIDAEIAEAIKESRDPALSLAEKVALKREAQELDDRRDALIAKRFDRKKAIRKEVNAMLDDVVASLQLAPKVIPLFTIRWELT